MKIGAQSDNPSTTSTAPQPGPVPPVEAGMPQPAASLPAPTNTTDNKQPQDYSELPALARARQKNGTKPVGDADVASEAGPVGGGKRLPRADQHLADPKEAVSGAGKSTDAQKGQAVKLTAEMLVLEAGSLGGGGSAAAANLEKAKDFLIYAVAAQGGVKPSDYLKAGMTAVGSIRDPKNMSASETENLRNFAVGLRGGLNDAGKKAFYQAAMLAKAIDPYFAAQRNQDIANGLAKRVEYQMGLRSPPPFNMANLDYALLGQGTDASAEVTAAIVSSLGRAAGGGGGSSDQVVQIFTPKRAVQSYNVYTGQGGYSGRTTYAPLEPAHQDFVSDWVSRNGEITAGNKDRLQHDLEQKFGGAFAMEQGVKSWAGQSSNAQALADNDKVAYTQWNADNTPKVYASNHLALGLVNQLKQNAQQFPDAVRSLNRNDVIALMERLEKVYAPSSNEGNRITGMLGYQKLSQLSVSDSVWNDYPAISPQQRGGIINAARVMYESPHLVANLGEVIGPGQVLIKRDHYDLYLQRTGAMPAALTGQVSTDPVKTQYVQAVRTLFSEDGWAALEYFEGADTNMNNKVIGGRGLDRLSQAGNDRPITGPDDPRWGAGNLEQFRPEIKISPERRAELIQAAKIVNGYPTLRAQVFNSSGQYTADSVANFLNANPVLLNPASTAQGLASDPAQFLNSLAVTRNQLSTGASIGLDFATLGLGSLIYNAANPPKFSQTQNEAHEALTFFGRPTDVLDKAMNDARSTWQNDLISSGIMAGAGLAAIFAGGPATAVGSRAASAVAGTLSKVVGQSAGKAIASRALVPIVENIVDPVGLAGLAGLARAGGNALLQGVRGAANSFGQGTSAGPALEKLVGAAARGQDLGAPLADAISAVRSMPQTAESARVLQQLQRSQANWAESQRVAARLGGGAPPPGAAGARSAALQSAGGVAQSPPGATLKDGRFVPQGGSIPRYPKSTTEWIYNDGGKLKNIVQYAGGSFGEAKQTPGVISGTRFVTDPFKVGDNTVQKVLYKSAKDGKYYDTPPAQLRDSDVVWNDASKQRGRLYINDSSSTGWGTVDVVQAGNGKPIPGKLQTDGSFLGAKPSSLSPDGLKDGRFDPANRYYPWRDGKYRLDKPAGWKPTAGAAPAPAPARAGKASDRRTYLKPDQDQLNNVKIGQKTYDIRRQLDGKELPPGQADGTRFGFTNAQGQKRVYYDQGDGKFGPRPPKGVIRPSDVDFMKGGNGRGVFVQNPASGALPAQKVEVIKSQKGEIWQVTPGTGKGNGVVTAKRGGTSRQFKPGEEGYEMVSKTPSPAARGAGGQQVESPKRYLKPDQDKLNNVKIGQKTYDIRRQLDGKELPPGQADGTRFGFTNAQGQKRVYYDQGDGKFGPKPPKGVIRPSDVDFKKGGNGRGVFVQNPTNGALPAQKVEVIKSQKGEIWQVTPGTGKGNGVVTAKRGGTSRQFKPGEEGYEMVSPERAKPAAQKPALAGQVKGDELKKIRWDNPSNRNIDEGFVGGEKFTYGKLADGRVVRGNWVEGEGLVATNAKGQALGPVYKPAEKGGPLRQVANDGKQLLADKKSAGAAKLQSTRKPGPAAEKLVLGGAPVTLKEAGIKGFSWPGGKFGVGEVKVNGKQFDVVRTGQDENIIGRYKTAGKVFEATDVNGKFVGKYTQGPDGKFRRMGLPGGQPAGSPRGLGNGASTSGASGSGVAFTSKKAESFKHHVTNVLEEGGVVKGDEAIKQSGIPKSFAQAIAKVTKEHDTPIIFRPVNPDSTPLLEGHVAAKGMEIKGKSADWGPQKGYIPYNEELNKNRLPTQPGKKNPNDVSLEKSPGVVSEMQLKLSADAAEKRITEAIKAGGKYDTEKGVLTVDIKGKKNEKGHDGAPTGRVAQFKFDRDDKTGQLAVSVRIFEKDKTPGKFEPLEVMSKPIGDKTHNPYTADLDLWSVNPPISNITRKPVLNGASGKSLLENLKEKGIKVTDAGGSKIFTVNQYNNRPVDYKMTPSADGWKMQFKWPEQKNYFDLPIPYHGPDGSKAVYPRTTPGEFTVNNLKYATFERIYNPPKTLPANANRWQKAGWSAQNQTGSRGANAARDSMFDKGGPGQAGVDTGFNHYMREEVNAAVRASGYKGGDVVLHGPETDNILYYDKDSGVSVFGPDGKVYHAESWGAVQNIHNAVKDAGYHAPINPVYNVQPGGTVRVPSYLSNLSDNGSVTISKPLIPFRRGSGSQSNPAAGARGGGVALAPNGAGAATPPMDALVRVPPGSNTPHKGLPRGEVYVSANPAQRGKAYLKQPDGTMTELPVISSDKAKSARMAVRQDDNFVSQTRGDGKDKSHISRSGRLTPAGDVVPPENIEAKLRAHVKGGAPESPFTSLSAEKGEKSYGAYTIAVDIKALKADVQKGAPGLKGVRVFEQKDIVAIFQNRVGRSEAKLKENLGKLAKTQDQLKEAKVIKKAANDTLARDNSTEGVKMAAANDLKSAERRIQELEKELKTKRATANKSRLELQSVQRDLENTKRDNEILIYGQVPTQYIHFVLDRGAVK